MLEESTMSYPERFDAPEADAAEQAVTADPLDGENDAMPSGDIEAPEWDAREQSLEVPLEDDYR
jgi:hypothetical protein